MIGTLKNLLRRMDDGSIRDSEIKDALLELMFEAMEADLKSVTEQIKAIMARIQMERVTKPMLEMLLTSLGFELAVVDAERLRTPVFSG